jgi:hypothetical protein
LTMFKSVGAQFPANELHQPARAAPKYHTFSR